RSRILRHRHVDGALLSGPGDVLRVVINDADLCSHPVSPGNVAWHTSICVCGIRCSRRRDATDHAASGDQSLYALKGRQYSLRADGQRGAAICLSRRRLDACRLLSAESGCLAADDNEILAERGPMAPAVLV